MNNADMPINGQFKQCGDVSQKVGALTKREYFAGLAMQGFASLGDDPFQTIDDLVETSVKYADALLAELEKSNGRDESEVIETIKSSCKG